MNWNIDTPEGLNNTIAWVEDHVLTIKPGRVWIIPRSMSVYRIHRTEQRVTCVIGGDAAVDKVFKAMNWRVET